MLISEYKSSNEKIEIQHISCGHTFEMKYRFFVNMDQRCPKCRLSKGEEKIKEYLDKNNFKYINEFRINNCRDKRPLPFDFSVEINDQVYLIEYDGIQHFQESFNFESKKEADSLNNIIRRDNIKNEYCDNNQIPLLRIKYTDFDKIDIILKKFLVTFND